MKKSGGVIEGISGKGLRIGIVASRFNGGITGKLLHGAERTLRSRRVSRIETVWVPGAFEIPLALQALAVTKRFDALIALGAVIRGETPHFDYVAKGATEGVLRVSLDCGIPIAFGVLTTDNIRQAMDRAGGKHGNKGSESALVAIEMAQLLKGIR